MIICSDQRFHKFYRSYYTSGFLGRRRVPGQTSGSRADVRFPGRRQVPGQTSGFPGKRQVPGQTSGIPGKRQVPGQTSGSRADVGVPGQTSGSRANVRFPGKRWGSRANVGDLGQTSGFPGKRRGSRPNVGDLRQTSGFPGRRRGSRAYVGSPSNARAPQLVYITKANCMSVCMFAMHAQTAGPIRTTLGTSVPLVPGMVIGQSNFGSGCPKMRENQKKQKKSGSNETRHQPQKRHSGSKQRTRLKIRDREPSSQRVGMPRLQAICRSKMTLTTFFLMKIPNVKPAY